MIILYRLNGIMGAAVHFSMFANGDFVGELPRNTYAQYEADKGHAETAMMLLPKSMGYPPPVEWWSPSSPCLQLDWLHLDRAGVEDVWNCKAYIRRWTTTNVRRENGIYHGKMNPALAVLDAVGTQEIPVGQQPAGASDRNDFFCLSCFAGKFEMEIESGGVYYIECSLTIHGAKWVQVDADTGAKKVRALKQARSR